MKIKTKLFLGLGILVVLALFQIGVGWYQNSTIRNISGELTQEYDDLSLARLIQREMKDEAISLRNILIFGDPADVQQELAFIKQQQDAIMKDIQLLEQSAQNTEQLSLVMELKQINQKYNDYVEQVTQSVAQGNKAEATRHIQENAKQLHDEFFQAVAEMTDGYKSRMNTSLEFMASDMQRQLLMLSVISLLGMIFGIGYMSRNAWTLAFRLKDVSGVMQDVASGRQDLHTRIEVRSEDEIGDVARSFNSLAESLEKQIRKEQDLSKVNQEQTWIKSNIAEITTELSGLHDLEPIARTFLSKIVPLTEGSMAAFYLKDEKDQVFKLLASYAYKERKHAVNGFSLGEGLVGQAALEKTQILLTEVPADYIRVRSGLGESAPVNLYVLPVQFNGEVKAVVEIASFVRFNATRQALLDELVNNLGIILDNVMGRIQLAHYLEQSQLMTEELQAQSEELQSQQEELRSSNEELEAQAQALRQSEERLQYQQEELEQTNSELREKAAILESQFKELEATNREVERARAELEEKARELTLSSKYKSEFLANMSHELRTPLNSLLILSKLLAENAEGNLTEKQVEFSKTVYSSGCDLLAIINDILDMAKIESGKFVLNANKIVLQDLIQFVEANFRPVANQKNIDFRILLNDNLPEFIHSDQQRLEQVLNNLLSNAFKFTDKGEVKLEIGPAGDSDGLYDLYFSISDTGIGIPKEKHELIFEAFQQADGTTSRKYGGTGLGLSICRQIASLLGGEITVESEEGKGSRFTFFLKDGFGTKNETESSPASFDEVAVSVEPAEERAVSDAKKARKPAPETNSHIKRLLIVDDDSNQRNSLMELIGEKNVIITAVSTGSEALEEWKVGRFDCILLDLGLSDTTGFDLLEKLKSGTPDENCKIIIYTGRDLTSKEEIYLKRFAHTIIIKDEHSPQRLLHELELQLNANGEQAADEIPSPAQVPDTTGLARKKVLLVDDDVRNVFALSNVLEMYGMVVTFAENGKEALKVLKEAADVDIVLMDIMMPEMDGYETMRRIREMPDLHNLPVIALTAKAMKQDREKCIQAGASDYIVKPVNTDQLISLIRVWLYPEEAER